MSEHKEFPHDHNSFITQEFGNELAQHFLIRDVCKPNQVKFNNTTRKYREEIKDYEDVVDKIHIKETQSKHHVEALEKGAARLEEIFARIDKLEPLFQAIHRTVGEVSARVDETERLMNARPLDRVMDSIKFSRGSARASPEPQYTPYLPPMNPLNVFRTDEYFPPHHSSR
ncbi:uncharacterized protein VTP21DRAFT_8015 [Calcarisporiella thermophila]|uniref:uncharacterized protein n=1 Tax=Calcarisporiella thermophila TaxID=911321 RepID=UPI003744147D